MVSSFCEVEGLCIAYERTAGSVFQIVVNNIMQGPHSKRKRKAQKQRKSSVSELFDLVTRTGIEPMIPPWKGSVLTSWPTGHIIAAVGFEPTTNRVWTEYSSQLSYAAILCAVHHTAFLLYYIFWWLSRENWNFFKNSRELIMWIDSKLLWKNMSALTVFF